MDRFEFTSREYTTLANRSFPFRKPRGLDMDDAMIELVDMSENGWQIVGIVPITFDDAGSPYLCRVFFQRQKDL